VVGARHDAVAGDRHRVGEEAVGDGRLGCDVGDAAEDQVPLLDDDVVAVIQEAPQIGVTNER
jgi:hypothetical protein